MRKLLSVAAAMAAVVAGTSVGATNYPFTFNLGTYSLNPTPQINLGTYTDTFTFTVATPGSFSGSITTRDLFDTSRSPAVVSSDLDFLSIFLDTSATPFIGNADNTDIAETYQLASTMISAGQHAVSVTYRVDTTTPPLTGASYGGVFNFVQSSVPEPAAWAMFIAGFGLVGTAMRRSRVPHPRTS